MALGGSSLLISSVCKEPSGPTRVRRERAASMRTLKRISSGTSGPLTELFSAGLDSRRTACATTEAAVITNTTAAASKNAARIRQPGDMIILFANHSKRFDIQGTLAGKDYTEVTQ